MPQVFGYFVNREMTYSLHAQNPFIREGSSGIYISHQNSFVKDLHLSAKNSDAGSRKLILAKISFFSMLKLFFPSEIGAIS